MRQDELEPAWLQASVGRGKVGDDDGNDSVSERPIKPKCCSGTCRTGGVGSNEWVAAVMRAGVMKI